MENEKIDKKRLVR